MAKAFGLSLNYSALLLTLSPVLLLLLSLIVSSPFTANPKSNEEITSSEIKAAETIRTPTTTTATTHIFGVKIEKNPSQSKLDELGVTTWPKWSGQPSKIPWTFKTTETIYLLEGKVKVSVDGYEGSFEIGAGDLVVFPKGMKITWDVLEAVSKHYSLEK
ncbi:conserved hypothetical protein [Ricinus communis]|uniref:(S)-ureidoglycine aminohydrolase cupin domain-containing protein n=1 Tax=Ricinus communis TaxID=3988 RepID=B9SQA9_RICCO|nr:conserved hypothetical protein [Ricinus communis]|eukprot:XP_002528178.1 uncharacterized protein LOC8277212 [Ricinus communis]